MQDGNVVSLYLNLGCWGRTDDHFITCPSVNNPILLIHKNLENYDRLIKYLQSVQLFNRKITDYNAVRNILFKIENSFLQGYKPIWNDKHFRLMENFTIQHRSCGLYLSLEFLSDVPEVQEREIVICPFKE
jgi:hypothetical protein